MTREFLSDDEFISEFSHTVLHNKNVFAMTTQILEESRQKEFQNPKDLIADVVGNIGFLKNMNDTVDSSAL